MWDFSLQVCWRWKGKIPSAWGQYRSFYGALEHTWNINLLTFHLQTLGTHSPFTQIPSFAFLLFGNGTKAEKNKNRTGSKKHVLWSEKTGLGKLKVKEWPIGVWGKPSVNFFSDHSWLFCKLQSPCQKFPSFEHLPVTGWKGKGCENYGVGEYFSGLRTKTTLICLRNIVSIYFYWHITILCSAYDKGLGTEKIYILCEKKCFSLATTLKLKFCGISTFKAMELSTL